VVKSRGARWRKLLFINELAARWTVVAAAGDEWSSDLELDVILRLRHLE